MTLKHNLFNGRWNLFFGLFPLFALAQPKFNLAQIKAKYPDAEMAYLSQTQRINIDIKDGRLVIENQHQTDRLFLTDRASQFADDRVSYSEAFEEVKELKVTSHIPQKTGFKSLPVSDITTEKPSPGGGVFYDDSFVKKFTYSGAKQGGVGSLSYTELVKSPFMLVGFVFGNYVPIINAEYSITFPAAVRVSYKTFGDMTGVVFKQSSENGKTKYSWQAKNVKDLSFETQSPSLRHYVPQVFVFIENYSINGQTTEVLGTVPKLFNYYKSLLTTLNQQTDKDLKALTDSLTNGKSEIEKIKSVYYWVQDRIKYVAFEEGLGGFVPRQAADVCRKRYGDCKDMASLITAMLNMAQVSAKLVWIGTRDIPYRYEENPSMSVDNHMIAAVKIDGQWQYLDATDDRIDFGLPTSHIQGKEGMIMTDANHFEIAKVPVVSATQNYKHDTIILSWNGRTLLGQGKMQLGGLWKAYSKSVTQYMTETKRKEYFDNILSRASNKCTIDKNTVSGYVQHDVPLGFDYSFHVPDYVQNVGKEVFINPHLTQTWQDKRIEDSRKNDIKYEYKTLDESIVMLPIPQDYELTELPKNVLFSNPDFGFDISYEQKDGKVVVRTKLLLDTILVKKSSFGEWNKMVAALGDARSEVIVLRKKS